MLDLRKRVNIITGHYGSGKTNLSINLAYDLNQSGKKVCLVDLDTVNPYFRAADMTENLEKAGIRVIAPVFANTNLDVPALPPSIHSVFADRSYTVLLDIGGDDAGASALGQFSKVILEENDFESFYVINARRALTQSPEDTVQILRDIEFACHIPVTSLINNTNLAGETDIAVLKQSFSFADKVAEISGLPLRFTSIRSDLADEVSESGKTGKIYPVSIYIKAPWD